MLTFCFSFKMNLNKKKNRSCHVCRKTFVLVFAQNDVKSFSPS